jgi:3-phosphoglycerate kinase
MNLQCSLRNNHSKNAANIYKSCAEKCHLTYRVEMLSDLIRKIVNEVSDGPDYIVLEKKLYSSLNDLIDNRVNAILEEKKSSQSQERIAVIDAVNTSVRSTASTVRSITALNSAPAPIEKSELDALLTVDIYVWFEAYRCWYNTKRKDGMTIK